MKVSFKALITGFLTFGLLFLSSNVPVNATCCSFLVTKTSPPKSILTKGTSDIVTYKITNNCPSGSTINFTLTNFVGVVIDRTHFALNSQKATIINVKVSMPSTVATHSKVTFSFFN